MKHLKKHPKQQLTADRREWLKTLVLGVVKHFSPDVLKGDYRRMDIPPIPPSDALDLIEEYIYELSNKK